MHTSHALAFYVSGSIRAWIFMPRNITRSLQVNIQSYSELFDMLYLEPD